MKYTIHPAAACYPMIEGEAWERFKASIERNGDNNEAIKINTVTGLVLDGRNRLQAYQELGREPKIEYVEIQPENELAYIKSLNDNRRHMDEAQLSAVGVKMTAYEHGTNQYKKKVEAPADASINPITEIQAAEHLGVSRRSIQRAKKTAKTDPELFEAQYHGGRSAMRELQAQRKAAQAANPDQPRRLIRAINPEMSGKILQRFLNIQKMIEMERQVDWAFPWVDMKDLQIIKSILPQIVAFIQEQEDAHRNPRPVASRKGNDRTIPFPGSTDIH